MRTVFLLIACSFLFAVNPIIAQYEQAKDGFAVRANFANYRWPQIKDNLETADFTSGLEVEYVRHLNDALNLAVPLKLGKAEIPLDEAGNFESVGIAGLDALLQLKYFRERNFIFPYLFAGIGTVYEDFEEFGFAAPLGGGLDFRLAKHLYLSTKAEYRVGFEDLRDNVQIGGGLRVLLGPGEPEPEPVTDADGDGIPDEQDLCPQQAGTAGLNGCPDADLDGIPDGEDECPDVAGIASMNGCPDSDADGLADKDDECPNEYGPIDNNGCPLADSDGDGIVNEEDECPDVAGLPAFRGCPDSDGDGVPDREDDCPNAIGDAATNGCPDSDGDGISDADDRCPNSAGPAANQGCPEITEEEKEILDFATQAVQFETGSARLTAESRDVLNQIVGIMRRYPDYNLRIGGHTDSTGSASTNQQLSEERAKACYDYFVSQGISPGRMSYAGYGETRPIADNRYRDGREQNRRVEFDLFLKE